MTDTDLLNWLEEHADDVSFVRDVRRGKRVTLSFCAGVSGCPVDVLEFTLRDAVNTAIRDEQEIRALADKD